MYLQGYFALKGEEAEAEFLKDEPKFFFSEYQLRIAHDRWVKRGRPKFVSEPERLATEVKILREKVKKLRRDLEGWRPLLIFARNVFQWLRWRF